MSVPQLFQTLAGVVRADPDGWVLIEGDLTLDAAIQAAGLEDLCARPGRPVDPVGQQFLPPLAPNRLILVGFNYQSHVTEVGAATPSELVYRVCAPPPGVVVGAGACVPLPREAPAQVDYEGEIAVVIGRRASNVSEAEAATVVAGITACIDLSARDVQREAARTGGPHDPGVVGSKMYPSFKPLGPGLIVLSPAELQSPNLSLQTWVNGELRQSATAADMIFSILRCVAEVSASVELRPGDVISTGTPAGVGFPRQQFLVAGDTVSVQVGPLPALSITVQ
jgi:2-keto-4-pentenoate hydratase/2-oxohepta-3-ene-1,7-dioic acid hydratase in catechol pathway